jgi:hypothetical protein
MSYCSREKNDVKKLTKYYEYILSNDQYLGLMERQNVIEIGFWISDITQN